MPLNVLFVRHGESRANLDGVFANRIGIPGDLTPIGIAQAASLTDRLKPLDISHVYTSPLTRARQTADVIARMLRVPVTETDALREYDVGDFEGLSYRGDHAWRWERYESVEQAWREGRHDARHPGGESLGDLARRFLPFVSRLVGRHGASDTVIAVGHGGLYRAVLPLLFDNLAAHDLCTRPVQHGDIIVGVYMDDVWMCERWGNDSFVSAG